MTPVISVIVTCYNQEAYIKQCLDGIVTQKDCPPFEIIIGDDCSTDNTRNIIKQYAKTYDNIVLLKRKGNLGMLHNLKQCLEHAKGQYIAICEGDDYWIDKRKLKKQYDALSKDNDAYLCFSNIKLLSNNKYSSHLYKQKRKLSNHITILDLLKYNYIGNFSCCMYKKQALDFIHKSYWNNYLNADFVMHLYILHSSKYAIFLKEPLSVYRILPDSISHKDCYPMNLIKIIRMLEAFNITTKYKYVSNIDDFCIRLFQEDHRDAIKSNYNRVFGISFPYLNKRIMVGVGCKDNKNL